MPGALKCLLLPWWILQIGTGAKSFIDNPVLGSRRLNRLGLHTARLRVADLMARWRRRSLRHAISPQDRAAFDRDGFVVKRDFLPRAVFEELRGTALAYRGTAREMAQGDTVTRRIALDPAALQAIPAARHLLADPIWRGLIHYAGSHARAPLAYIQSIITRPGEAEPDPQTCLHADTFHATVKAWLFLTDVGEEDGPFCYVAGSHRATPQRMAWERRRSVEARTGGDRLSARGSLRIDEAALAELGLSAPRVLAVPANTLVVADTHGFHARRRTTRPTIRAEIWAYGRRSPFVPWRGLDLLGLPGLAERRIGWMWGARDRLQRWLGQPWREVGPRRPLDARTEGIAAIVANPCQSRVPTAT